MNEAIEIVKNEMRTVGGNLTENELIRAKDYLLGKTQLMMDRSSYWTSYYGEQLLLEKKAETVETDLENYKKAKLEDLKKLAGDIFIDEEIRLILIKNK